MQFGFVVIIPDDYDLTEFLAKYYHEYDGDDVEIEEEFVVEIIGEDAKKMWEEETRGEKRKTLYPLINRMIEVCKMSFEEYMHKIHHVEKDTESDNFGYLTRNNPLAMYDWYEVGGRWEKTLIKKKSGKECNEAYIDEINWEKTFKNNEKNNPLFLNLIDEDENVFQFGSNEEALKYIEGYTSKNLMVYVVDMHT